MKRLLSQAFGWACALVLGIGFWSWVAAATGFGLIRKTCRG